MLVQYQNIVHHPKDRWDPPSPLHLGDNQEKKKEKKETKALNRTGFSVQVRHRGIFAGIFLLALMLKSYSTSLKANKNAAVMTL